VQVISVFGGPVKGCPLGLILDISWKKMSVFDEYYEGWTYTILWDGKIEEQISHEWIVEIEPAYT